MGGVLLQKPGSTDRNKHSEGTFSALLESPRLFQINVHRSVKLRVTLIHPLVIKHKTSFYLPQFQNKSRLAAEQR